MVHQVGVNWWEYRLDDGRKVRRVWEYMVDDDYQGEDDLVLRECFDTDGF